jgi:2-hydroxychromene-2-carboxylate isomerase
MRSSTSDNAEPFLKRLFFQNSYKEVIRFLLMGMKKRSQRSTNRKPTAQSSADTRSKTKRFLSTDLLILLGAALLLILALTVFFTSRASEQTSYATYIERGTLEDNNRMTNAYGDSSQNSFVRGEDVYVGRENASIILKMYFDVECSYCHLAHRGLTKLIEEYPDELAITYRHFPLRSHTFGRLGALALECAKRQGVYWEYLDSLFSVGTIQEQTFENIAQELSLDMDAFTTCKHNESIGSFVDKQKRTGEARGVQGTPTIFMNDERLLSWRIENLRDDIKTRLSE